MNLTKKVAAGILSLAVLEGCDYSLPTSENKPVIIQSSEFHEGPVYSLSKVPANMCSRYLNFAAQDLFGIRYPRADAWDVRDAPNVDEIPVHTREDVIALEEKGILTPGRALGLYNPKSKYNGVAKNDGAGYTHVVLYIGKKDGKLYFADKFGKETRTQVSLEDLLAKGNLEPREVLFVKDQ